MFVLIVSCHIVPNLLFFFHPSFKYASWTWNFLDRDESNLVLWALKLLTPSASCPLRHTLSPPPPRISFCLHTRDSTVIIYSHIFYLFLEAQFFNFFLPVLFSTQDFELFKEESVHSGFSSAFCFFTFIFYPFLSRQIKYKWHESAHVLNQRLASIQGQSFEWGSSYHDEIN